MTNEQEISKQILKQIRLQAETAEKCIDKQANAVYVKSKRDAAITEFRMAVQEIVGLIRNLDSRQLYGEKDNAEFKSGYSDQQIRDKYPKIELAGTTASS